MNDQPLTGAALARWCYDNPNQAASTIEGLRGVAQAAIQPATNAPPKIHYFRPADAQSSQQPAMWVCLVDSPVASEKHIRAWTSKAKRAESFRAAGLDMQPLYAVPPPPAQAGINPYGPAPAPTQALLDMVREVRDSGAPTASRGAGEYTNATQPTGSPNIASTPSPVAGEEIKRALSAAKCTSPDGTFVHASTDAVLQALSMPSTDQGGEA